MAKQKQIQKKIRFALSSQTSKENLSFVIILLILMSLVRTRLNSEKFTRSLSCIISELIKHNKACYLYSSRNYIILLKRLLNALD